MADVKESAMTQQSDCKWVRALDANGNSIRISKEDLASVVGGLIGTVSSSKSGLLKKGNLNIYKISSSTYLVISNIGSNSFILNDCTTPSLLYLSFYAYGNNARRLISGNTPNSLELWYNIGSRTLVVKVLTSTKEISVLDFSQGLDVESKAAFSLDGYSKLEIS